MQREKEAVVAAMQPWLKTAPWILRITERKPHTGAVLVINERYTTERDTRALREYGSLYDCALRLSLPVLRLLLAGVHDDAGRTLGLETLLADDLAYRGQIPLDQETGAKIALLAKLHPNVHRDDRIELMAWRIERFSREEALYWLTKVSVPSLCGRAGMEWAKSGLRTMLAGHQTTPRELIAEVLERLRK